MDKNDKNNIRSGHALRTVVVTMLVLLLAGGAGAQTNISSCTTISSPGEYVLNTSINNAAATCIGITSSNVTLDGAGYTIDGTDGGSTYGVYVYNSSITLTNVTVKNLKVTDWSNGIYYRSSQNGSVANNTASSNSYGINLYSSSNNTLTNNTASSNSYGIYLESSSNSNTLTNNTASSNPTRGIYLSSSSSNTLTNNNASNANTGIHLYSSSNNTLTNNNASNGGTGIDLESSSNSNTLTNNTASSNTYYGIALDSSSSNTLTNNTASSNVRGIELYSSSNSNTLTNNTANSNSQEGIYLSSSSSNTLTNNTASSNTQYGIYLYSSSNNNLTSNTASSNPVRGIYLSSSNSNTLTNNTARLSTVGIYLYSSSDNTLTNNNASNNASLNTVGIYLYSSSDNTLTNNTASSNSYGIELYSSSNSNTLTNNTASSNSYGIYLYSSSDNTLTNNTANSNSQEGIYLSSSGNSTLANNSMTGNGYNFDLVGSTYSNFDNTIYTNNTVDGKPVFYIKNASDTIYDSSSNAGIFYCFFCNNVTIKDLAFTKNGYGVFFWGTNNSKIENVNASSNVNGIRLDSSSSNNTLTNNTASSNSYGIYLYSSSSNNTLTNNTASSNTDVGIRLYSSSSNTLTNNNASNNTLWAFYSISNSINNTVTNLTINPTISFTGKDVAIKSSSSPASDPDGYKNISKFINATNNSADSWLFLNVSFSDSDVAGLNESSLRMWRYNGSAWSLAPEPNNVNTGQNYAYANITAFSIFALLGTTTTTTSTATTGAGSGGGSGGGGVVTSEPYTNIEKSERYDKSLIANTPVTYAFKVPELGVYEIAVTSKESENDIALKVEALKGTSKQVTVQAPGTVYKNINILAGTKRIKEVLIRFKFENSWLTGNNFAGSDVKLVKWDGSQWVQLETSEKTKDASFMYFEAKSDSLSSFAIVGLKGVTVPTATPAGVVTETPAKPTVTAATPAPTPATTPEEGAALWKWLIPLGLPETGTEDINPVWIYLLIGIIFITALVRISLKRKNGKKDK